MEPLEYEHPSLFRLEDVPESPALEPPELGIRINARGVRHDGAELRFELLLTHCFPRSYLQDFQRIDHALSCMIEDTGTGRVTVLRLIDRHKKYPPRSGPNFRGPGNLEAAPTRFRTGHLVVPFQLSLPSPPVSGSTLFITVFLQHHVSNTLAFDVRPLAVDSFLGGHPFHIVTVDEAERAEAAEAEEQDEEQGPTAPSTPGAMPPPEGLLELALRKPGPYAPGEPVILDTMLALTPERLDEVGAEGWIRSVFLCATRQDNQTSRAGNGWKERLVYPDDLTRELVGGQRMAVLRTSFELADIIGDRLRPGAHYLHASARQFRSRMVEIVCK